MANAYTHEPWYTPSEQLLTSLSLDRDRNYAALYESEAVRQAVAARLGLRSDVDYCDIAQKFIDVAASFTSKLKATLPLTPIRREPISMNPDDFEY